MTFSEPLQLNMAPDQKQALETYKDLNGVTYNYIVDRAIQLYISNMTENSIPKAYEIVKGRRRVLVRLSKETFNLLKEYCDKNNAKMSPTAITATMQYLNSAL